MNKTVESEKIQDLSQNKNVYQGKDITQLNVQDIREHFASSGEEFCSKMEENFTCWLFIAPSKGSQNLEDIVRSITNSTGYKMHKSVGCSELICHIYVKYDSEGNAFNARDYFRNKYHAEIVQDILRIWYAFEKISGLPKSPTIALFRVSDSDNFTYHTADLASQVLRQYGNPGICAVVDRAVKVSFNSIAEAFAASIALGKWYCNNELVKPFYYSVRIQLSYHCERIMRMCNMTDISSQFDYFEQYNSKRNVDSSNTESKQYRTSTFRRHYNKRYNRIGQRSMNGDKRIYENAPHSNQQTES